MASITHALRRIKNDLANLLAPAMIEQICREQGYQWRDRLLNPVSVIHLFILQILHGNVACACLPRITGREFTASAYCQARKRLPLKVITTLVARIGAALQETTASAHLWHGHRVIIVDGSGFSMPDTTALDKHFGKPGARQKGCGFPVAHMLTAFDVHSGLLLDVMALPLRTHDMAHVHKLHARLRPGDLLVGDRGFCSYSHLTLLKRAGLQACLRMHQKQIVDFRPHRRHACVKNSTGRPRSRWLRRLGLHDQLVDWVKPASRPGWMNAEEFDQLPESMTLRELRYRVRGRGLRTREITLVTTLLDAEKYPAQELAELFRRRWQVETNLRHLKITLGMDVLRCRSLDGVMKEMWVFILAYNLVRMVMLEAARRQKTDPDRISFVDALRWLTYTSPGAALTTLLTNPERRNRIEPRVIKRRMKEFNLMKRPRNQLRKELRKKKQVA